MVVGPGTLNVTIVLPIDAAAGLGAVDVAHKYVLDRLAGALREGGTAVEVFCSSGTCARASTASNCSPFPPRSAGGSKACSAMRSRAASTGRPSASSARACS